MAATHNSQRYFGLSSVSGNVQTHRCRHTHIPKTPKSQHLLPALPSCSNVPALLGIKMWLSPPLLISVTSTCMAMRSSSQENPAFHGGCWRKPNSPPTKGRGHILNEGTQVLMRNLAKSTVVAAVIPSARGFRSDGRGIRKTQSSPLRKTSCSLFHPGVWVPALVSSRKPRG